LLNGQNGGIGFQSAWVQGGSDFDSIVAGNLTYPNYASFGNSVLQTPPQDFSSTPFREVNTIAGGQGGPNNPLYISYLVRKISDVPTAPTPADDYFGLVLYGPPGQNNGIFIGDPSETSTFALGTAGLASIGLELSDDAVNLGQTSLLLVKIDFSGGPDTISLYVNPDLSQALGTPDAIKTDVNLQNIQAIGFVGGYGTYQYDEIRSATSLGEVRAGVQATSAVPDSPIGAAWLLLPCFVSVAMRRYGARQA